MKDLEVVADKLKELLGAEGEAQEEMVALEIPRDIAVMVQGRPFKSETAMEIHFEGFQEDGTALNHAEIVLLPEEVPDLTIALGKNDIPITALHNHWLFAEPAIKYLHVQTVEKPEAFAKRLAEAFKVLKH
ncbi:DUF1259 domain-containing protein [Bacillus salacetis]|uniref:DUF1259 domain-containing protein n=1 Tax=Bacillus salacetis TaxID=2315464 RepID=A0A3A1R5L4_9BACI|nr:DUF1259 domain-containing protein [Bacillus salacetis]RIW38486.1 DUF1259 domain-containing protein [Bacillus salacetis]